VQEREREVFNAYPPAEITPRQFENLIGSIIREHFPPVATVAVRQKLTAHDATYELDLTVRCRVGGLDFLADRAIGIGDSLPVAR